MKPPSGGPMTGPTYKGLWGKMEKMSDGTTIKVDENYVRDSILNPNAHIVAGFSAPYQYVFSAYFDSPADVQKCMADPRMGTVLSDVPNYFAGVSDVMVGDVVD